MLQIVADVIAAFKCGALCVSGGHVKPRRARTCLERLNENALSDDAAPSAYAQTRPLRPTAERFIASAASLERSLVEREVEMASFEAMFRIPPTHVLAIRYHRRGDGRPERWVHVEYDDQGQFVARYVSEVPDSEAGDPGRRIEWQKFAAGDLLIASGDEPIRQC